MPPDLYDHTVQEDKTDQGGDKSDSGGSTISGGDYWFPCLICNAKQTDWRSFRIIDQRKREKLHRKVQRLSDVWDDPMRLMSPQSISGPDLRWPENLADDLEELRWLNRSDSGLMMLHEFDRWLRSQPISSETGRVFMPGAFLSEKGGEAEGAQPSPPTLSFSLQPIPTPGAVALLGMGWLLHRRRRRDG